MATQRPLVSRVWASAAATSNVQDPDTFSPGKVNKGWISEIPPYQWFNWVLKRNDELKRSLVERGIAAWGGDVDYLVGALSYDDSNGVIYLCTTANKGIRPSEDDGTSWVQSAVQLPRQEFDDLVQLVESHMTNVNNPHKVTAAQINAYTKPEIDALLAQYDESFKAHLADFNNPHKVTAEQAGAVPITGGTYKKPVNFTQSQMFIGSKDTGFSIQKGYARLFNKKNGLGVDASGKPVFTEDTTSYELLQARNFNELTRTSNPAYRVPIANVYLPLNSDICIYEGEAFTEFSRASRGMYLSCQDLPTYAEVDEPRFCPQGYISENTSTNLIPWSNPTKDNFSCGQGVEAIVQDDQWGIFNMTRFNASDTWISFDACTLPAATIQGKTVCGSFYLRKRSADESMKIYLGEDTDYVTVWFDESKNTGNAHVEWLAEGYYRVWLAFSFAATAKDLKLYCMCGMGDALGGPQVEFGTHPSSWIPTTDAPATRAEETLSITPSFGTGGAFTVAFTCDAPADATQENRIIFLDSVQGISAWFWDGEFYVRTASGFTTSFQGITGRHRHLFTYDTEKLSVYRDGVLVYTEAGDFTGDYFNDFGKTYIGCNVGSRQCLEGHIQDLQVWHQYMTPEQCSTI